MTGIMGHHPKQTQSRGVAMVNMGIKIVLYAHYPYKW